MKKLFWIFGIFIGLFIIISCCFIYFMNENKVAILGYHSVMPKDINASGDNLVVDAEKFEKELKLLKTFGYETMTLDEFYCWKKGKCDKKHKSVLITFDDGYTNNYDYAFPLLKKYGMDAVVFSVGMYAEIDVASEMYMNLDKIKEANDKYPNIEFASHSYDLHFHSDKTYDIVDKDSKKMLELIDSEYYAYPYGDYNDYYIKALKDNNYKLAFTFGPGSEHRKADIDDDDYKVPRLNISNDMSIVKFLLRVILPM